MAKKYETLELRGMSLADIAAKVSDVLAIDPNADLYGDQDGDVYLQWSRDMTPEEEAEAKERAREREAESLKQHGQIVERMKFIINPSGTDFHLRD